MAYLTIDPSTGAVEKSFNHSPDEGVDAVASQAHACDVRRDAPTTVPYQPVDTIGRDGAYRPNGSPAHAGSTI